MSHSPHRTRSNLHRIRELLPRYKQNSTKTGQIPTTEKPQVIVDISENHRETTQITATVEKKKECPCCKERMEKVRERLAQLREKRRQSKLPKENK